MYWKFQLCMLIGVDKREHTKMRTRRRDEWRCPAVKWHPNKLVFALNSMEIKHNNIRALFRRKWRRSERKRIAVLDGVVVNFNCKLHVHIDYGQWHMVRDSNWKCTQCSITTIKYTWKSMRDKIARQPYEKL